MSGIFRRAEVWFLLISVILLCLGYRGFQFVDTRLRDVWVRWRVAAHLPEEHPWLAKTASWFPLDPHSSEIVLAMYDDRAYLGIPGPPPPWNRRVFAEAIRGISRGQHRVLGIDLFFRGPSVFDQDQDRDIIDAVRGATNTVLISYRRDQFIARPFPAMAEAAVCAPPYFYPYIDESIRKASLVFRPLEGPPELSFVGQLARLYWGLSPSQVEIRDREVVFHLPAGDRVISLSEGENVYLNYNSLLRLVPVVSIFDLFHGKADPALFTNKIVLMGLSNSMLQDRFLTPTGYPEFGSLIHAITLQNVLSGTLLHPPAAWEGPLLGVLLLLGSVLLLGHRLAPMAYLAVTLTGCAGLVGFSWFSLIHQFRMVEVTPGLFGLTGAAVFSIGLRYYTELSEKIRIRTALQHYVTPSVVAEVLRDPSKLCLHGEERILTVLFSDIVGFTTISEGMPPIQVVNLLNEYLTEMTEVVFQFEGMLDKYEGDAIMAVFGAPIGQTDHAVRACRCALANQRALRGLREKWRREGRPELRARIGINTGVVVVGNMGSRMRFEYTVIGDNVNLASRLETANKLFQTEVLVGETTAELAKGEILTRGLGRLQVLGRLKPVQVFEVLTTLDDPDPVRLAAARAAKEAYETAFRLAREGNWSEALAGLDAYRKSTPDDFPVNLLGEQIGKLAATGRSRPWNGIWLQEGK